MKKPVIFITAFILTLCLAGCSGRAAGAGVPDINTISGLLTEKGYTEERILEELSGQNNASLAEAWGAPDAILSGLWGDIWYLSEESGKEIIVYYDKDGFVEHIKIADRSI